MKRVSKRWIAGWQTLSGLGLADEPLVVEYTVHWSVVQTAVTVGDLAGRAFLECSCKPGWWHEPISTLELSAMELVWTRGDRARVMALDKSVRLKFFERRILPAIRSTMWAELPARELYRDFVIVDLAKTRYWFQATV